MSKAVGVGSGPVRRGCPRRWQRFREAAGPPASGRRRGGDVARRSLVFSVVVMMALGAGLGGSRAQNAAGTASSSAAGASGPAAGGPLGNVTVEEWLNQTVRLRDTVQALDRPAADGRPSGEIRAGAGIKAIGLVAGRQWVQIELPNRALAYVPRTAIEFENAAAGIPAATPTAATPATATSATATPAAATSAGAGIHGPLGNVPNAATLVVADQRIRLSGIDPGPQSVLGPFENWLKTQGALQCEPDANTGRYRCFTGAGVDIAQAAILNGSGRVGDGATPEYRQSENEARTAKRGLWAQP